MGVWEFGQLAVVRDHAQYGKDLPNCFEFCKSGKRRKTGAKCAVHKDENCFLSDPT